MFLKKYFNTYFLIICALLWFIGVSNYAFWDDFYFIFQNHNLIKAPHPFVYWGNSEYSRSWPLTYSIFWILVKIFSHNFIYYKFINIIIHIFNSLLIKKITSKYFSKKTSLIAALFFLIHPLQVESVSWIFQLKTILSTTFFLLCMLYLNRNLLYSFIFFFLSLKMKITFILFPVFFLFLLNKRLHDKKVMFFLFCSFILSVQSGFQTLSGNIWSKQESQQQVKHHSHIKKIISSSNKKDIYRTSIEKPEFTSPSIFKNFTFYILKFIYPHKLMFLYPKNYNLIYKPYIFYSIFFLFFIIIVYLFCIKNIFIKYVILGLLLSFIPISALFYIPYMKYSFVADHWAYPMIIFLSILIAFLLIRIPSKLISWSFIISFFIFFLLSNIKQQHIFKNEFSIIEHNIIHNKTSSFLYYYLAKKNYDIGDYQSAIDLLEKAQKINSNDPKIIFLKKKIISTLKQ